MLLKFILIHQNLMLWLDILVRGKGLEPSRPFGHSHLKAARLPIPPTPRDSFITSVFLLPWSQTCQPLLAHPSGSH